MSKKKRKNFEHFTIQSHIGIRRTWMHEQNCQIFSFIVINRTLITSGFVRRGGYDGD